MLQLRRGPKLSGAFAGLIDAAIWIVAIAIAALARYDFDVLDVDWSAVSTIAFFIAVTHLTLGHILPLYRGRYRVASFDEMLAIGVLTGIILVDSAVFVAILQPDGVPRSIPVVGGAFAIAGMLVWRYALRVAHQRTMRPAEASTPVLVYGAGEVGSALVWRMIRDPQSPFRPVGFLDDDPRKRNLQLNGVRVRGDRTRLAAAAVESGAAGVIVAINSADADLIREVSDEAASAGLRAMVLPSLSTMFDRSVRLDAIRDVDVVDVIGRRPVDTDISAIAHYVTNKRVLVTGAGGSIGSELCRQLKRFGPSELIMLDRDESGLHGVQLSLEGHGLLDSPSIALVDIRDTAALGALFRDRRPEVVFHAAALKHLPLLERYPQEAWKSNVLGTRNVLQAAADVGVERFVNISTDKAANPTSALGHSKRLAEQLTASFAERYPGSWLSVRFGNVLGSRGSVLHAFSAQIAAGGPVTVTDPEVTRFFMTIPEACELVVQAGAIGRPGEVLVLDMGEPVKIVDVAHRMIAMADSRAEVVFTGLRPGEKLHEELFTEHEHGARPFHPLVSHVTVPPVAPGELDDQPWAQVVFGRIHFGSERVLTRVDAS